MSVKFKLNHHCFLAGCIGAPGDVVDIDEEQAAHLERIGGGKRCGLSIETADANPGDNRGAKVRSTRKATPVTQE